MYIANVNALWQAKAPDDARAFVAPFPEVNYLQGSTPPFVASHGGHFAHVVFPVGTVRAPHPHTDSDEWYYILSGRASVTVDGETQAIGPGDVVLTRHGSTHHIHDVTAELVFIAIHVPCA